MIGGWCLPSRPRVPPTPSVPCWATTAPLLDPPAAITKETLLSLVYVQRAHWRCFQYQGSLCQQEVRGEADPSTFTPSLSFQGLVGVWPLRLQTRDTMQLLTPQTQQLRERIGEKLLQLRREEAVVLSESPRLCLVCDEQVEQHAALRKGNIQSSQSASSGCGRCWGVPGCWDEASGCRVAWVTQRLSLRWCCPWPTSSTHSWSWSLPALMLVQGPTWRLPRESRLL
ncbi:uncharacterized protein LOC126993816 [Eriocheir sinensis]|uniref:uncharacterized protein LOC126993816 n=1 Tax=Eriocheir sinensis TaxID=95602 RepID=UPI0021C621B4|nr:uncharacterized protein LOC126993816 [Eriocheir sinensis]